MTKDESKGASDILLRQIRAIIFDLDVTLIRSAVDFGKLKRETIDLLVGEGLPVEKFSVEMKSYHILSLASELCRQKELSGDEIALIRRKVEAIWNRVELESVRDASLFEGAKDILLWLRKRGIKIGIVTRGCRAYAINALTVTGLLEMVDIVVGRDDTVQPKPHPEPLMRAMSMLGFVAEEVLMVGDSVDDEQCARGAGVHFLRVMSATLTEKAVGSLEWGSA